MEGGGKREQSRKTTTRAGVSTSILLATVDPSGAGSVPRKRERGEEEWRRIDQLDGKYLRRVTSGVSAAWRSKSRGKTLTTWVRREKKREVEER